VDFYDGCLLYDFTSQELRVIDLDMYSRGPFTNTMGRIFGSTRFMAPEEFELATDHPEARTDACAEVVAAPVARAHGIAVPHLLAFQAGEYSLWERVHAETLSELPFLPRAWRELGGELARLHNRVRACEDPSGWLDTPGPTMIRRRRCARSSRAAQSRPMQRPRLSACSTPSGRRWRRRHADALCTTTRTLATSCARAMAHWSR
jgi:hypothetical protein